MKIPRYAAARAAQVVGAASEASLVPVRMDRREVEHSYLAWLRLPDLLGPAEGPVSDCTCGTTDPVMLLLSREPSSEEESEGTRVGRVARKATQACHSPRISRG